MEQREKVKKAYEDISELRNLYVKQSQKGFNDDKLYKKLDDLWSIQVELDNMINQIRRKAFETKEEYIKKEA